MNVAQTILDQLGGNKFIMMTGAKQLVAGNDKLMFSIGRGAKDGINKIVVILGADDLYRVEFWKMRGVKMTQVNVSEGVYADQLQATFTRHTGFVTYL